MISCHTMPINFARVLSLKYELKLGSEVLHPASPFEPFSILSHLCLKNTNDVFTEELNVNRDE